MYNLAAIKKHLPLILFLIFYLILGIYYLPFFQYQQDGDSPSIITQSYALLHGDFYHFINAYWGITSAVIMAPFLTLPFSQPLIGIKIASLTIGIFGLSAFYFLTLKFDLRKSIFFITISVGVSSFLYFVFKTNQSDLLILTLILFYLNVIFSKDFGLHYRQGAWIGLIAGLLVLTKEYFIYYFVAHFTLFSGFYFITKHERRTKLIGCYLLAILIFFIISTLWGLMLQNKYHKFMFGSRGVVNLSIFGPQKQDYVMFTEGLIPPPNPYGLSSWDDPTLIETTKWNPLASKRDLIYVRNLIIKNSNRLIQFLGEFTILWTIILIGSFIYVIKNLKHSFKYEPILLFGLITFISYPLGYLTLSLEARYIWLNSLLLLLFAGHLISKSFKKNLLALMIFLLVALTFLRPTTNFLRREKYIDHTFYDQSKILKNQYSLNKKKIATNSNWHQTLYISFYNKNQYYGFVKPFSSFESKLAELKKYEIDYYFSWNDDIDLDNFRKHFKEIKEVNQNITNLRVFDLKKTISL